ncbi:hypothetical protein EG329_001874 [Mollisiaceae sp. DMI_Dod_QoI]|nr:hypothetical protein EG329_001874 [Helotiales sp. DMI_Dod_QoI]
MPLAWCCGSSASLADSDVEEATTMNIRKPEEQPKPRLDKLPDESPQSIVRNATTIMVDGDASAPTGFTQGGMNIAVKRDEIRTWSSADGRLVAKQGGILTVHDGCREPLRAPTIDVVAVHGLNSNAIHAWTHEKKVMWLEDLLPEQLPNARIMTYGYNSSVYKDATSGRIQDHAKGLLNALDGQRSERGAKKRPIIFVCHSLGGLVVKQALVFSQMDKLYSDIRNSTYGIVFLATPHRGSSAANLASTLSNIAVAAFPGIQTQLLKALQTDSTVLGDLIDNFRHLASDFQIASFYELKPTSLIGGRWAGPMQMQIVAQSSAVMDIGGERQVPMNADHRCIARYSGEKDPLYIAVSKRLCEMAAEASVAIHVRSMSVDHVSSKAPSLAPDVLSKLRAWLNPSSDLDHERSSLRSKRCANTGDWIFLKKEYLLWRECETSSLLWLHARPGAGKSVLAAHLIENLEVSGLPFGYFFFKYNNESLSSPKNLLRSICFQLCSKHTTIYDRMVTLMESGFDVQKGLVGTLWQQLFKDRILKLGWPEPMFWVIDGLDECDKDERAGLLRLFADLDSSPLHVKMIILSRRTKDISDLINNLPFKIDEICPEDNHDDIMTYARRRLSGSTVNSREDLKGTILDRIEKQHSGTFLWVQTALDQLDQQDTVDGILESLSSLPGEMNAYYLRILKSISSGINARPASIRLAKAVFDWTTVAARPLFTDELRVPLTADFGDLINLKASIANHCGGLIDTDPSGRVEAIHMTVAECLQSPSSEHSFYVDPAIANARVAGFCFKTITSTPFQEIDSSMPLSDEFFVRSPFAQYAIEFTFRHLGASKTSPELTSKVKSFLTSPFLLKWIKCVGHLGILDTLSPAMKHLETYLSSEERELDSPNLPITSILFQMQCLIAAFGYITSARYVGDLVDGKRHGYGTSYTPDGGTQTGNWLNDQPEGFSIAKYLAGSTYAGEWKQNEWHGNGHWTDPEGNVYKGDYSMGKKHGVGIMTWTWGDRHKYTGQWSNDRNHGTGEMIFSNGGSYQGQWREGLMHGRGRLTKWNDDAYEGEFVDGVPQGPFIRAVGISQTPASPEIQHNIMITFSSGSVYEGDVVNGRPDGEGELRCSTGLVWKGRFKDGMMNGPGIGTWLDGGYSKGTWKEDQPDGFMTEVNNCPEHLCKFEGMYKMGIREGEGEMWQPVGYHYKGHFHIDEIHGYGVRNRVLRGKYDGEFLNGLEHGHGTMYMPGKLTYKGMWRVRKKHDNGAILTFRDGSVYKGAWIGGLTRKGDFLFLASAKELTDIIEIDEEGKIGPHQDA